MASSAGIVHASGLARAGSGRDPLEGLACDGAYQAHAFAELRSNHLDRPFVLQRVGDAREEQDGTEERYLKQIGDLALDDLRRFDRAPRATWRAVVDFLQGGVQAPSYERPLAEPGESVRWKVRVADAQGVLVKGAEAPDEQDRRSRFQLQSLGDIATGRPDLSIDDPVGDRAGRELLDGAHGLVQKRELDSWVLLDERALAADSL